MLTRDCKRWVDVISKKIKELGKMGVPAAFCYIDSRITDVYTDAVPRNYCKDWHKINASQPDSQPDSQPAQHICLPKFPGPLKELNVRTLKSVVTATAEDMRSSWSGEWPYSWPEDIPFTNPRQVTEKFQGSWRSALKEIIAAAY